MPARLARRRRIGKIASTQRAGERSFTSSAAAGAAIISAPSAARCHEQLVQRVGRRRVQRKRVVVLLDRILTSPHDQARRRTSVVIQAT